MPEQYSLVKDHVVNDDIKSQQYTSTLCGATLGCLTIVLLLAGDGVFHLISQQSFLAESSSGCADATKTLGIPVVCDRNSRLLVTVPGDKAGETPEDADLPSYRLRGVKTLLDFLRRHLGSDLSNVTMLENGSDVTGNVGNELGKVVAKYVGVNCPFEGDDIASLTVRRNNTMFLSTDCKTLPFLNETFDVVFSDNVLEHVSDLQLFIRETFRVLKPGGLVLFLWDPVWTGPFGHHIHEDMVQRRAERLNATFRYANNGSFIPPWGHLLYTKQQLREMLTQEEMGPAALIDGILEFIFNQKNINRRPLSHFWKTLHSFSWVVFEESNQCQAITRAWTSLDGSPQVVRPRLTQSILQALKQRFPLEDHFDIGPCTFAASK